MIIDSHTHIGRNEHINATVDELLESMDEASIDKALVFAGKLNDIPNDFLLAQIAPHKDRLYGVACFHPGDSVDDIKKAILHPQVVAVKFYVGYDHWYPNDDHIADVLYLLSVHNKPAIFHCGDCLASIQHAKLKYAHPLGVDDPAVDYPDVNFVIAHIGYPWVKDTAEVCYKNKNVFTDISGFVYGDFQGAEEKKFQKVINEFLDISSVDKLLFGSDWPISNQKSYVDTVSKHLEIKDYAPYDLTSNTKRVFNLK